MKAALYARVSTDDKGQNPQVQLDQLYKFCQDANWEIYQEYVDQASACDFIKRKQWARLMKDASMRKFNVVLVWKLDRMCRSCIDGTKILETLRAYGIAFRSMTEQWIDTTTPWGEALYHISAAWAGLERNLITERVNAGLESARRHGTKSGKAIGRPRRSLPVLKVLDAYRHSKGNFSKAADSIGVPGVLFGIESMRYPKLRGFPGRSVVQKPPENFILKRSKFQGVRNHLVRKENQMNKHNKKGL
jgi:DNA invertase Pin-like site-specific DNA recombinase